MPAGLMLFVPMYNCAPQIRRTLGQLDGRLQRQFEEVFVLDNGSSDDGPRVAMEVGAGLLHTHVRVAKNDSNYGLGGSHKVAFQRCLDEGYDGMVVFHGDDQGRLADLADVLDRHDAECVLGSRFMLGSSVKGYSVERIAANVAFNVIFSVVGRKRLWDLGSGLNFYRRDFIARRLWEGCADDLTFNYHLILRTAAIPSITVDFVPISWREDDQVSNAKLTKHGLSMLRILARASLRRRRFLHADHSAHPGPRTYEILES